jgi:benzodiazapine receptor
MGQPVIFRSVGTQMIGLLGWLLLTFAAASIGALASAKAGTFYAQLERPGWAPPGWLFGPVWSILYILMGIAAWLVWRDRGIHRAAGALGLFVIQLAANALWTWLFFVWQQGLWAFVEVLLLWMLILATCAAFWRHRHVAGALLLPYLAWVTFAVVLTWAIWQMNPIILG